MDWSKLSLMPKSEDFYVFFEESARNVLKGVDELLSLLKDFSSIEEKVKRIGDIEHQGDKITHQTIEKLNKTFVTELDREDIHSLISEMDDILDLVDAVARKLVLYKIKAPTKNIIMLAEILRRAVEELNKALPLLRNLRKCQAIIERCIEINSLENEGDQILRASVASLFENPQEPIEVLKWKEIYENLETAIDRCEDVANILEGIMLKYS